MRIALDKKAEDCFLENSYLQLRTPLTQYKKHEDLQWVLDNGCYSNFKPRVWKKMVDDAIFDSSCIWFTMPDEVGNHEKTLQLFNYWKDYFDNHYPQKIGKFAFVLQDGCTIDSIPWDDIRCVFLGGTTKFKYSRTAYEILEEAHKRYKWVHIGRVNTKGRIVYFYDIAHSIDGTGLSKYSHMYKEAIRAIDHLWNTTQYKIIQGEE
tara:strand:- start:1552 stop:2172 length:621 start_codon:yes stop_codon:yes gene_type:complete